MKNKKILVISHDASLTGAPLLLIRLMKLLKERGYAFNSLIGYRGGVLTDSFKEVSDECAVFKRAGKQKILRRLKNKVLPGKPGFHIKPLLKNIDCVISNTITNGELLQLVKENSDVPVISYIHELETVITDCTNPHFLKKALDLTDHFIVPANVVKEYLCETLGVSEQKISTLNYFIPEFNHVWQEDIQDFKNTNSIKASFIVGACGSVQWRKGTDIFIQVASLLFKKMPDLDIQFVWLGGRKDHYENQRMMYDIKRLGLEQKILVIEGSLDASAFFKSVDLFLLTSREDPYPLVVLEAATEKIPTLCFNKNGGAAQFVGNDAGTIVNYLDVMAMVDSIRNYYCNRHLLKTQGNAAQQKVKYLHQNKDLIFEQFNEALQGALNVKQVHV